MRTSCNGPNAFLLPRHEQLLEDGERLGRNSTPEVRHDSSILHQCAENHSPDPTAPMMRCKCAVPAAPGWHAQHSQAALSVAAVVMDANGSVRVAAPLPLPALNRRRCHFCVGVSLCAMCSAGLLVLGRV